MKVWLGPGGRTEPGVVMLQGPESGLEFDYLTENTAPGAKHQLPLASD